jgi:hypothetical protein
MELTVFAGKAAQRSKREKKHAMAQTYRSKENSVPHRESRNPNIYKEMREPAGPFRVPGFGCALRVSCQVLAYQAYAAWAWSVLPWSALLELAGLTAFAVNILGTFLLQPSHVSNQPVVVGVPELLAQQTRQ